MKNQIAKFPYQPYFFRMSDEQDRLRLDELKKSGEIVFIYDEIERQLNELIRCRYPAAAPSGGEVQYMEEILGGRAAEDYGVWVYYPWRKTLVHILEEKEFVEVRTNRNQLKITGDERELLSQKKIGIIGLSVGQSIALTIAMERVCGVLRLADFDELDLSNMNRLRTGVFNIAVPKVVIAAREIAEIDPYLKVEIFPEGINRSNYDRFFNEQGSLDVLVEVCDSFDVKLESRFYAKDLKIPVVMDTNDRGMLDIERFDLDPGRPVFHGLADDLTPAKLSNLSAEEKGRYLMKIVDAEKLSLKMKRSVPEIRRTIVSWPQLASEVVLGGAMTTAVCRRILLGERVPSGRYYIDLDQLISSENL
ncbi:MAG TPA: Rv1355c family protein [Sphingobacterium sp.]|nr:Rv1355c family protein [Sphingobacterium sp.]